jgi:hypothetical protein
MPAIRSALVVTAVWSIATGGYFAYRDDLLTRPMTEMQITSEDHVAELPAIADLRAQAERIMSQLDQGQVEQKLNALLQRQATVEATVEQRTSALTDDQSATGSINSKAPAPDRGSTIGTNGPSVAVGALAVSKPTSASARKRHGPRAHRRLVGRLRQHGKAAEIRPVRAQLLRAQRPAQPAQPLPAQPVHTWGAQS